MTMFCLDTSRQITRLSNIEEFGVPSSLTPCLLTRGNTCCQLFFSDTIFIAMYPMRSLEEFEMALHWFCKDISVPMNLIVDAN